jgi:uncharacterized protein
VPARSALADFGSLPPLRPPRTAAPGAAPVAVPGARLADRLRGLAPPEGLAVRSSTPAAPGALEALAPARQTAAGALHLVEGWAGAWPELDPAGVSAVGDAPGLLDVRRPLFLDTETTGLAGGTGTLPFLVGVALEREGRVVVEQVQLEAPGRERVVLAWLASRLAEATLLVTFNGKSFDWPLLRSRYVMNRLPVPPTPPHLDLLHCARRVFRHDATQHTLAALERRVLGVERVDDLPGALIPAVWFDYLRSGRVSGLGRVLEHNRRDVVSMVDLLRCLLDAWHGRRAVSAGARLALARLAAGRGDDARAWAFLAGPAPGEAALAADALELKGAILRRRGAVREAAFALEAAARASPRPARLRLALARLYERQLRDFEAAHLHALAAGDAEPAQRHQRRLLRLRRRASSSPALRSLI